MIWNYRVMKRVFTTPSGEKEDFYGIHEVYYDEERDYGILYNTVEAVEVGGDTLEELKEDMKNYLKALDEPVLDYDNMIYLEDDIEFNDIKKYLTHEEVFEKKGE